MEYTPKEIAQIRQKVKDLLAAGMPEVAIDLRARLAAGEPIHRHEYDPDGVVPEKEVDPRLVEPPPRTGPGSSAAAWQEWAANVMDIEDEVLATMTRKTIIQVAKERSILPKE